MIKTSFGTHDVRQALEGEGFQNLVARGLGRYCGTGNSIVSEPSLNACSGQKGSMTIMRGLGTPENPVTDSRPSRADQPSS